MQRDQRAEDNWALLYAQQCALERSVPLLVLFNLTAQFGDTTWRHYDFMLRGLKETAAVLNRLHIPFVLTQGDPIDTIPAFIKSHGVGQVVTDFNPLRFTDAWREQIGNVIEVQLVEVDAHNIIPCWEASGKEEYAAYTFRPKVHRCLADWLVAIPPVQIHPYQSTIKSTDVDWGELLNTIETNRAVPPVTWLTPGSAAARQTFDDFVANRLETYASDRNDPNKDGQSNLSPYLHFGQLSAQQVALGIQKIKTHHESKAAFLEELIVRRELTDNYCFYNHTYDKVAGAHAWAQQSIKEHVKDAREYLYAQTQLEGMQTHDELWNAMQSQLVTEGKLHGWCRMYWAKKILEWTPDVQSAIDIALYLNDTYSLDGTDPNGVVGVMWSICGVHDRAWTERPVFGKIRYMNYNGAKRKFDVSAYVEKYAATPQLFNE